MAWHVSSGRQSVSRPHEKQQTNRKRLLRYSWIGFKVYQLFRPALEWCKRVSIWMVYPYNMSNIWHRPMRSVRHDACIDTMTHTHTWMEGITLEALTFCFCHRRRHSTTTDGWTNIFDNLNVIYILQLTKWLTRPSAELPHSTWNNWRHQLLYAECKLESTYSIDTALRVRIDRIQ